MNLSEALNAALPELPAQRFVQRFPRVDPRLKTREEINGDGETEIVVYNPTSTNLYRFSPLQWQLINYFDGKRSFREVAQAFEAEAGVAFEEKDVREFAEMLDESDFWYKTPQERNIALQQKLSSHREKHAKKKSRWGDMSHMQFSAWDPDRFLSRTLELFGWVYSRWFTALTLALFAFMLYVFIVDWGQIGSDTLKYYTFTDKSFYDLAEFWLLFLVLGFFHETAHGLTCKYYGGEVHSMGFHLIYLTPAFFVDVTEAWVHANRMQRLVTIMAGIWVELIICAIGTVIWWGTSPGTYMHELAYKIILITGVAVVLINVNPLIKLDGYLAMCEMLGIADIKEKSTAYVSSLVKKHVWGLPVEVEPLPRRRIWFFVPYALLSGAYSYMLLSFAVKFSYNVFHSYWPDWAFVPAGALAWLIFRGRIRNLVRFMKTVYLDKKERLRAWFTPQRRVAAGALLLIALFAPVWRETVQARFIVEPVQRAVVRTSVPGVVAEVYAREGETVAAGAPLLRLRNLQLESDAARAQAESREATARATQAQLRYAEFGPAEQQRRQAQERARALQEQQARLRMAAPIAGTVVTPRLEDRVGSYLEAGTEVAAIADLEQVRVRVFLPEFDMRGVHEGAPASLYFDALASTRKGEVGGIAPAAGEIVAGLVHKQDYKGIRPPNYYAATIVLPNDGSLREGMSGTAKILVQRRSIAGFVWQAARDFVGRKLW